MSLLIISNYLITFINPLSIAREIISNELISQKLRSKKETYILTWFFSKGLKTNPMKDSKMFNIYWRRLKLSDCAKTPNKYSRLFVIIWHEIDLILGCTEIKPFSKS